MIVRSVRNCKANAAVRVSDSILFDISEKAPKQRSFHKMLSRILPHASALCTGLRTLNPYATATFIQEYATSTNSSKTVKLLNSIIKRADVLGKTIESFQKRITAAPTSRKKSSTPRPASAYNLYLKEQLKGSKGGDIQTRMKDVAASWKSLSADTKAKYQAEAAKLKAK